MAKIGNRGKGYETIAHFFVINRRYEEGIDYYRKAIAADAGSLERAFAARHQSDAPRPRATKPTKNSNSLTTTSFRDAATRNSLTLMDTLQGLRHLHDAHHHPQAEQEGSRRAAALFRGRDEARHGDLRKEISVQAERPVQVEVYPNHDDFAVRAMGLPGLGALGVTFNNVVAMDSPSGRTPGELPLGQHAVA